MFSIARLVIFTQLSLEDPTWNFYNPMIWTSTEEGVGVICVCLPVMAPLLKSWGSQTKLGSNNTYAMEPRSRQTHDQYDHLRDNNSERGLVPGDGELGIRKTTEYTVAESLHAS